MGKEAKILIGIAIATVVVVIGGSFLFSSGTSNPSPTDQKVYDASLLAGTDSYHRGSENPKVTVVEFGDLQCPACGSSEPIVEEMLNQYKDSVQIIFRHFPLPQHQNAMNAARAVEAAGEQGKFWELHDELYAKQDQWGERPVADALNIIEGYAKDLGLDMTKFKAAIDNKTFDAKINAGLTDGTAAGVDSTPTFFVDGKKQAGLLTLPEWKTILDAEIASKSQSQ